MSFLYFLNVVFSVDRSRIPGEGTVDGVKFKQFRRIQHGISEIIRLFKTNVHCIFFIFSLAVV